MVATTDITVRRAEAEDAEILTQTCKRAFESDSEVGAPGLGGPPGYDSVAWNTRGINNTYLQYHKILNGDDIVGGFIAGDRGPGYQVCERIWIEPNYMRKGIGQRAFELIWGRYPSADLWVLDTPEWNLRTKPFYEKVGFVQIGTTHHLPQWSQRYYEKRISPGFPKAMSRIGDLHSGQKLVVVEGRVDRFPLSDTLRWGHTVLLVAAVGAILAVLALVVHFRKK